MLAPELDLSQLLGHQVPRIRVAPEWDAPPPLGVETVEMAAAYGLILDDWQKLGVYDVCAERPDGRYEVVEDDEIVARQNGKNGRIRAVQLHKLYVLGRRGMHTAHEFKTAREHFDKMVAWIEAYDDLRREVKKIRTSHGEEGISLRSGGELRFVARSRGSGRGFDPEDLYYDEALILSDEVYAASLPSQAAARNPQRFLFSSAGNRGSVVLGRHRTRALAVLAGLRARGRFSFREYSPPEGADRADPGTWAYANPGAPHRISGETIAGELDSLSAESFDVERLSIGDYPEDGADRWAVIAQALWSPRLMDASSSITGRVLLAADINPEGDAGAIAAAGRRPDRLEHVEVVDSAAGVAWMLPRLLQLRDRQRPAGLVLDSRGRAWELVPDLLVNGFEVAAPGARVAAGRTPIFRMTSQDVAQAHGGFVTAVNAGHLRHLGQQSLDEGLAGASTRDLGDAQAWARKRITVNIAPVVAVTAARWGLLALEAAAKSVPGPPALAATSPVGSYDTTDVGTVGF